MTDDIKNVIIIGAGPSGLTAAIYAARAELNPFIIEGYQSGGQLMLTTEVENFPGFIEGVMGPDLISNMRKQAQRFGTQIISEDVINVDFSSKPFTVKTASKEFKAHSVIISTGANARWLGLDSEQKFMGRGVSSCATCDGAFFKDKEIVVVGGGDSAMEEALFLTKFATKVTVIHRRDQLRASKIMQDRFLKHKKTDIIWDSVIEEVLGDKVVTGLKIKNVKTGEVKEIATSAMFVAIGHDPNVKLFSGQINVDENSYIITAPDSTKTNIEGVFACGDVQDTKYKQAITAAGSGCMAALEAEKYLAHVTEHNE